MAKLFRPRVMLAAASPDAVVAFWVL